MDGKHWTSRYAYTDRNPCILAAGRPLGDPSQQVKQCLEDVQPAEIIDVVRRRNCFIEPKDYGPDVKPENEFPGIFTEIRHCLRPPMQTQFQILDEEVKNTIYNSYWNQSVGKCRDPVPGLPRGMDINCTTFGKPTPSAFTAGEVVNPRKTPGEIIYEDKVCHDMYRYSHQDYYGGERINRCYQPPYNQHTMFGHKTNKDERGFKVKRCLTWFNNDPLTSVSRRQAAVRNRTLPALGKGLDKTGVTDVVDPDRTYGKTTIQGFYSVAELLNDCPPSLLKRDIESFIAAANKMRQKVVKKINNGELILEELYEELLSLDKEKTCELHFDCIVRICSKYRIPMDRERIEPLFVILGLINENGKMNYRKFVDFINVNQPFPKLKKEHYGMPPEYQECDKVYRSTLKDPKCNCLTHLKEPAGMPNLRTDLSAPDYRGCKADMNSLGAETSLRAVISPSIFTQYGLSHRDFFKPRSKEFLGNLFRKIGTTLTDEDVDELYKEGYEMDRTGGVCVETFRNLLDVRAYNQYMRI